jgi:peptidase E
LKRSTWKSKWFSKWINSCRKVVNDLLAQGENVEIIPTTTTAKTPNFLVNRVKTELKSLDFPIDQAN